jgi:hypothetical protein
VSLELRPGPGEPAGAEAPCQAFLEAGSIRVAHPDWSAVVKPDSGSLFVRPEVLEEKIRCDYLLASVGLAWTLLEGGVLLHSSSVRSSLGALVFAGKSGAGKSTLSRLVCNHGLISDDQNVILGGRGQWRCFASTSAKAEGDRLARVFLIRKADRTSSRRLPRSRAVQTLLQATIAWPSDGALADLLLGNLLAIVQDTPCYELDVSLADVTLDTLVA